MAEQQERAPRYRVRGLNVIYDTTEDFWTGPVVDASQSGLFIETAHELPLGTSLSIMPDGHHDDDRLPFEVTGVVVRVNELDWERHADRTPGIAVRFEGLSADQIAQFHAFLQEHGVPVR